MTAAPAQGGPIEAGAAPSAAQDDSSLAGSAIFVPFSDAVSGSVVTHEVDQPHEVGAVDWAPTLSVALVAGWALRRLFALLAD